MNASPNSLPVARDSFDALVPSRERLRLRAYLALILADCCAIFGSFLLAGWVYQGSFLNKYAILQARLLLPIFVTIAVYQGCYSIRSLSNCRFSVQRMLVALMVSTTLFVFVVFYTKSSDSFSRVILTLGLIFVALAMGLVRYAMIRLLRRKVGPAIHNILTIDDGGPQFQLPHAMHIQAQEHRLGPSLEDPHALDRLGRYFANQDRVIVSTSVERREQWANVLKASGVHGELISASSEMTGVVGVNRYEELDHTGLVVSYGPLSPSARITKRLFDIVFTSIAMLVLLPVFILIAIAIKLDSRGPTLFVQRRLGRGNRLFKMYKFRSMRVARSDADGNRSASRDDDRITCVGRFLRRTSLDEIPQFFNVLKGDMSLVGPRPHALGSQAGDRLFWEIDGRYWRRHSIKPGLTGLAQVRGFRGATEQESDLSKRLYADLEYISRWSLLDDLIIILRTTMVVVHDRAF